MLATGAGLVSYFLNERQKQMSKCNKDPCFLASFFFFELTAFSFDSSASTGHATDRQAKTGRAV